jgi:hypothetical protein
MATPDSQAWTTRHAFGTATGERWQALRWRRATGTLDNPEIPPAPAAFLESPRAIRFRVCSACLQSRPRFAPQRSAAPGLHRKRISTVLAGQRLGIQEVDDSIWLVSFMHYDLGTSTWSRKPCNPSTTRSARDCHPCLRYVVLPICPDRTVPKWRKGWDFPIP